MASNSKNLGELLNTTSTVSPAFVSDQDNTSTGYFDLPNGTTAQRPSAASGMIRYNSTTSLAEYYDGNLWKSIDSPPSVASISPTTETDASANIVITGSGFSTNVSVKFVGDDGTEYPSPTVTRNSSTQVTATTPSTALSVANEPYDVVVTNTSSSLAGTLADALDAGGVPAFTTSAGTYTIYDINRSGTTFDAGATDPDGDTITYSVTSGSLPAGASISSSTGAITGFSAVGSNTSSTFTVSAATSSDTSTRAFTIAVQAPVITSYTSTGSFTFSVPTGITTVDALVVAAGGGSGVDNGGGGGAGGLIFRPAFPVTPGGSVSGSVGIGGGVPSGNQAGPYTNNPSVKSQDGGDSTFGILTSKGGGTGGSWANSSAGTAGAPGGSGGGECRYQSSGGGGAGTQPQQPGDSSTYGFGTNGGSAGPPGNPGAGGGGGGAGATGVYRTAAGGQGGAGKVYAISGSSVTYAFGGAGGSQAYANGDNGNGQTNNGQNGVAAQSNRGGGGSAGSGGGSEITGSGGSGIVIVKY